jgi:hypothetical protein
VVLCIRGDVGVGFVARRMLEVGKWVAYCVKPSAPSQNHALMMHRQRRAQYSERKHCTATTAPLATCQLQARSRLRSANQRKLSEISAVSFKCKDARWPRNGVTTSTDLEGIRARSTARSKRVLGAPNVDNKHH